MLSVSRCRLQYNKRGRRRPAAHNKLTEHDFSPESSPFHPHENPVAPRAYFDGGAAAHGILWIFYGKRRVSGFRAGQAMRASLTGYNNWGLQSLGYLTCRRVARIVPQEHFARL
jgi:hypothetical protein